MVNINTNRKQLTSELEALRRRVAELEEVDAEQKRKKEALKGAEQQLRVIVENTYDIIFQLSSLGVIQYVSPRVKEIYGYEPEYLIGKHLKKTTPVNELPRALETLKSACSGKTIKHFEINQLDANGKIFTMEINGTPVRKDGEIIAVAGIMRDITERKRAEEQLLIYQKQLRALASQLSLAQERERRRIAVEVHDRVNQTLAICSMKLETLAESAPSIRFTESLGEIQTITKQLIKDMRSFTFNISSPLLYELGLEAAVEHLTEQIQEQQGILLRFEDDGKPKPLEDSVRVLLFRMVRELLANITKHAQARQTRICIKRQGSNIQIIVEDDGIGFNTYEISSCRKRPEGFGLFSIREQLNYVGGHLEIESQRNRGTQVTIVAPLSHK